MRPRQSNRSRSVEDPEARAAILALVALCDYIVGDNEHRSTPGWIDDSFTQIGLAARADR